MRICWIRRCRITIDIGQIEAIYRYPVKSMRGEALAAATLGWHGIEGDRRVAIRRRRERGGLPWLTASRLPDLVLFTPLRRDADPDAPPTHVRTPGGDELPVFGEALAAAIAHRHGAPVEMMQLRHGIFDDGSVSAITCGTVSGIEGLAGIGLDARRFRPNFVIRSVRATRFEEDDWPGGVLTFGDAPDAPAIAVTRRDVRCAMVNIDPDRGRCSPEVLKAVVDANQNHAGIYGSVIRVGRVSVGQRVTLARHG